jgi:hypothetical protein
MKNPVMSRDENSSRRRHPGTGEPDHVAITVIACLVILLVFIVIAVLV